MTLLQKMKGGGDHLKEQSENEKPYTLTGKTVTMK